MSPLKSQCAFGWPFSRRQPPRRGELSEAACANRPPPPSLSLVGIRGNRHGQVPELASGGWAPASPLPRPPLLARDYRCRVRRAVVGVVAVTTIGSTTRPLRLPPRPAARAIADAAHAAGARRSSRLSPASLWPLSATMGFPGVYPMATTTAHQRQRRRTLAARGVRALPPPSSEGYPVVKIRCSPAAFHSRRRLWPRARSGRRLRRRTL